MPAAEWIGNPVRASVLSPVAREAARSAYGLSVDRPVIGVFGGSLGAGVLNDAVEVNLGMWLDAGVQMLHVVGARNSEIGERAVDGWKVIAFEDRMEQFYAACDLVIARAGGAVAELTATGTPSILVPGSFGSGGHQLANAVALEKAGAAVVVREEEISRLGRLAADLVNDASALSEMTEAARSLAKPDAAANISAVLRELHDRKG
jgi:UDP-N-acetylglucosamine--N-acetylmuramyl-(pentapeptide) pyrophosphoryl-undecaprenol N-acetylglucosamine transferase